MTRRLKKHRPRAEPRVSEGGEDVGEFFARELSPGKTGQAQYLTKAVLKAGARYERYIARKNEWRRYSIRRNRLESIAKAAKELGSDLCGLDIISQDDLANRLYPLATESLIGSLLLLNQKAVDLAKEVQKDGTPRDLAEERWIYDLADIYENSFDQPARVWKSGDGSVKAKQGSKFYRLLVASRPVSLPPHGKFSPRQVERTLKRRVKAEPLASL